MLPAKLRIVHWNHHIPISTRTGRSISYRLFIYLIISLQGKKHIVGYRRDPNEMLYNKIRECARNFSELTENNWLLLKGGIKNVTEKGGLVHL